MSGPESSPLLAGQDRPKASSQSSECSFESTPLLSGPDAAVRYSGDHDESIHGDAASAATRSIISRHTDASSTKSSTKKQSRLPSIIAMVVLALMSTAIIIVAFFLPAAVEEYVKEAAVLEPTGLSLESITSNGVRARVQATFRLDGSRVRDDHVRSAGRAATWMVRQLGTEETRISVYLPAYDNILLGTASVPPLVIDVVDGHSTAFDFVAEVVPGDANIIRTIANEWLEGGLDLLSVQAKAYVRLKSGIIPLGTHAVSESLTFEAKGLPALPEYNVTSLNFREVPVPGIGNRGVAAEASLTAFNKYPISVDVPELAFEILVSGCSSSEPYILVADAVTQPVALRPLSDVVAEVNGFVRELPDSLVQACPNSNSSPLDLLLKQYLSGEPPTVFVRGAEQPSADVPDWLAEILANVMLPVPFPRRSFDNLIRNFSIADVRFTLPSPLADPDDPDGNPKVSGVIKVLAAVPPEMNFDINVTDVRATADVFYLAKKLGELNLREWQKANSTKLEAKEGREALLEIQSRIVDAPLEVTDSDVLTDVVQALLFGDDEVMLDITAAVDVKVLTVLRPLTLKAIPAKGKIPVKPLPGNSLSELKPNVGNIIILETTPESIKLEALVNITNPTPYAAHIPSISIHILSNGTLVGEARAENLDIGIGNNTNLKVSALWNPSRGGDEGIQKGRDLLSEYLSGFNATVALRTHRGSFPSLPHVGHAMSRLNLTLAAPRLRLPDSDEGENSHFIRDATFHVFSSTATFTLFSPLAHNTLYLDSVNATAFYNHTEPLGRIEYDLPFACPPGASGTPKLPVEWSLDSVGYKRLKDALGGRMKLDAKAVVGVRLGAWKETLWYVGKGIGAKIRI